MTIDPNTTKYLIRAKISAEGIVEKSDVVGAIFGQSEGLLGDELDLRDLQKGGRIGRIEVEIESKKGRSEGEVIIPSSLDQVETAILASSLETIDRVGPCKAQISIDKIEDVRTSKRNRIVERAKELLIRLLGEGKGLGTDLTDSVRKAVQVEEITSYGKDRCPAGPNIDGSDAIIVVEGRSHVINLLKYGIKNAIAVEGTNVPKTVQEISKEKVVTAFVDGDRGGELILKELLQVAEVDFVATAPSGEEVEELTEKQIMKCLRNKIPVDQFIEKLNMGEGPANGGKQPQQTLIVTQVQQQQAMQQAQQSQTQVEHVPAQSPQHPHEGDREKTNEKKLSPRQVKFKKILNELSNSSKAKLLNSKDNVMMETTVRDLTESMKNSQEITTIIFDGIITQRLLDVAAEKGVTTIIGNRMHNVTKLPSSVEVWTRADLE